MKKIILEEINRVREIMGLNPKVITEAAVTDDLFRAIIGKAYREGARGEIDNFINSQAKKLNPGTPEYNIAGYNDLIDDASSTGKRVNELIPGIADDLFEHLLTNSNKGIQDVFKKTVKKHVFPEEILGTDEVPGLYTKWNKGQLTESEAESLKSNILNLYKGVNNDAMKVALDEMSIVKKAKGIEKPKFMEMKPSDYDDTQVLKFYSNIKDKILRDKNYLLTQGDAKMLDIGWEKSLVKRKDIEKLIDIKYPGLNNMFRLLDEYNSLYNLPLDKGGIGKISFEDWLEKSLKAKIPNKANELSIKTLRYFANPFRALAGYGNMSIPRAILTILGVTSGALLGANKLAEIIGSMVKEGTNVLDKVDYKVVVESRWKDYWNPDNDPKVQIGDTKRSIYMSPDIRNDDYKGKAPAIEVMDAENQVIKIMPPNKISINGKEYEQIYFELAETVLGMGEGTFNPDLIKPYEGGKGTQQQTQQQQQQTTTSGTMTKEQAKAAILAQGYTEPITFTPDSDGQTSYKFVDADDLKGTATLNNGNIIVK